MLGKPRDTRPRGALTLAMPKRPGKLGAMNESTTPPANSSQGTEPPALARHIGLFLLIVYGVGDMVGSGIYATIGDAAARLGNAVWLGFVASMIVALLTGLSYASLASRYPRAGGAAFITQRAYRWVFLSYVVGLTVTASGLTSMATNSNAVAESAVNLLSPVLESVPAWPIVLVFVGLVTLINFWGIRESMWVNVLCATIEVGGLLFIIAIGSAYWGSVDYLQTPPRPGMPEGGLDLWLVSSGAVLTFFAFVGFEDMLNVSEEVKNPERTMPMGMVIALVITSLLYLATSVTAVSVVDYHNLVNRDLGMPMAQVTDEAAPWLPGWVFEAITMFAAANSVLINYIMGSRMLYGMSRQGLLPRILGRVHHRRQTPHFAILALMVVVIVLAFAGDIGQLGTATGMLLLFVFCLVNAALVVLKYRAGEEKGVFEIPVIIPILGALTAAGLIVARVSRVIAEPEKLWVAPAIAGGLVIFIAVLYLVFRPRGDITAIE